MFVAINQTQTSFLQYLASKMVDPDFRFFFPLGLMSMRLFDGAEFPSRFICYRRFSSVGLGERFNSADVFFVFEFEMFSGKSLQLFSMCVLLLHMIEL